MKEPILITNCTKSRALTIQKMRRQGYPYKTIGGKIGASTSTTARYHRVLEKYGIDAFADDR